MVKKSKLTPAEIEVMEILWDMGHATATEFHAEVIKKRKLMRATVRTVIRNIKKKGYIRARERNFAYDFYPVIDRSFLGK